MENKISKVTIVFNQKGVKVDVEGDGSQLLEINSKIYNSEQLKELEKLIGLTDGLQ